MSTFRTDLQIPDGEILISPSMLAADFARLGAEIEDVLKAGADWLHLDVMDGVFVPNITFGPMLVEAMNRLTDAFLDVHLMIVNPEDRVEDFVKAGADLITVHAEATRHVHRTLQLIRSMDVKAGVTLNPGTPLSLIEPCLPWVDQVLVMSVSPGFGGQPFIEESVARIAEIDGMRKQGGYDFVIEIDGGVSGANAERIRDAGCDVLVAGSAIFKQEDRAAAIRSIRGV